MSLFSSDITSSSFLENVGKFLLEEREGFRASDMLNSLTRPSVQQLEVGLSAALKSNTNALPWLRKLYSLEITASQKVSFSLICSSYPGTSSSSRLKLLRSTLTETKRLKNVCRFSKKLLRFRAT